MYIKNKLLIIAPTRELIKQISDEAKVLGAVLDVDILPLIGGKTIESQLQQLGRRPHVILGTPGRLLDHAKRGSLHLDSIRRVVLDGSGSNASHGIFTRHRKPNRSNRCESTIVTLLCYNSGQDTQPSKSIYDKTGICNGGR